MEVLEEAGLPAGVVNFIPGSGSEIGDYLVDHPETPDCEIASSVWHAISVDSSVINEIEEIIAFYKIKYFFQTDSPS